MSNLFIHINNISLNIKDKKILSNVDIRIAENEIIGLLGSNGAGKTSLIKLISGIWKSSNGKILVQNDDINTLSRKEIASLIAYLPQSNSDDADFTVDEFLHLSRYAKRKSLLSFGLDDYAAIEKAIEITGIGDFRQRCLNELSGGEKQRVFIAGAIAQEAKLILFDEPTTFLDPRFAQELVSIITKLQKSGIIVMIATHSINFALKVCNRIIALRNGNLVFDGPISKFTEQEVLGRIYDNAEFKIIQQDSDCYVFPKY